MGSPLPFVGSPRLGFECFDEHRLDVFIFALADDLDFPSVASYAGMYSCFGWSIPFGLLDCLWAFLLGLLLLLLFLGRLFDFLLGLCGRCLTGSVGWILRCFLGWVGLRLLISGFANDCEGLRNVMQWLESLVAVDPVVDELGDPCHVSFFEVSCSLHAADLIADVGVVLVGEVWSIIVLYDFG